MSGKNPEATAPSAELPIEATTSASEILNRLQGLERTLAADHGDVASRFDQLATTVTGILERGVTKAQTSIDAIRPELANAQESIRGVRDELAADATGRKQLGDQLRTFGASVEKQLGELRKDLEARTLRANPQDERPKSVAPLTPEAMEAARKAAYDAEVESYLTDMRIRRIESPVVCNNCETSVLVSEEACPVCSGKRWKPKTQRSTSYDFEAALRKFRGGSHSSAPERARVGPGVVTGGTAEVVARVTPPSAPVGVSAKGAEGSGGR